MAHGSYQTAFNAYMSIEHNAGFSIRSPFFKISNKFFTLGTLGYGVPPNVIISHNKIPYDHLQTKYKIINLKKV